MNPMSGPVRKTALPSAIGTATMVARAVESASAPASAAPGAPSGVDATLLALTDQCVMCGLCLPHCPTYRLDPTEAESPRGRIALARALANGGLAPTPLALTHLDQCLGCLSCQKVCPSLVQYDQILSRTRAALRTRRPPAGPLQRWLHDPQRLTLLARVGAVLRAGHWLPPLAHLLPRGSMLRRILQTQPDLPRRPHFSTRRSAAASTRGRVALFRGCVASVYDRDTLGAARVLLEALDYEVVETSATLCCGALQRHTGEDAAAAEQAAHTRASLQAAGVDVVLVSASGCYGDLRDQVLAGAAPPVVDIHAFLAADARWPALSFKPLSARVALHLPCTQVNVVGDTAPITALLATIPGLAVLPLPLHPRCCGAAGSYFIEHPAQADRLREEKLDQAAALAPDLLLTTNIGCRIHLDNGLRAREPSPLLLHPLALLAQQLENPAP